MNIRDQKAQAVKTQTQAWQDISVGDTVVIYVRPGQQEKGKVTQIELDPIGDYPMFWVDVPAYGVFTRKADDCQVEVTVALHMVIEATEVRVDLAADIARSSSVKCYGTVADWEVWGEGEGPGAPPF